MAKYNQKVTASPVPVKAAKPVRNVIGTKKNGARATTFEGHEGYQRKDKSALFLLAALLWTALDLRLVETCTPLSHWRWTDRRRATPRAAGGRAGRRR